MTLLTHFAKENVSTPLHFATVCCQNSMVSFEEAFDLTGHGKFNNIVLLTCGLVIMYTNVEALGVGYIMTAAECDLELSAIEEGLVNAAAFIGIMITAIAWGYMGDQFGRRSVMLPTIVLAVVVSLASSFAVAFWYLFMMRFLTGCFVSASSATVYAYLGEMHSTKRRSEVIAFAATFIAVTFIAVPLLAWVIMAGTWSFPLAGMSLVPWRVFIWSWSIPGVASVILLLFLPESPRYLFAMKGQESAMPVLAKMYAWNNRKKKEDYPVQSITVGTAAVTQRGFITAMQNVWLLVSPPLRRCILISHFSMFLVFLMSSGLYTWMPIMLNEMLQKVDQPLSMCSIMHAQKRDDAPTMCIKKKVHYLLYPVAVVIGTVCAITYIACGFIMRKCSKICIYCWLLIVGSLMLTASSVIPQPVVDITLLVCGLASGCSAAVLAAIAAEVFPTSVRALAFCTMYMSGRLGAAVGSNLLGTFLYTDCVPILLAMTLITAASALLMLLWPDPKLVRSEMERKGFTY